MAKRPVRKGKGAKAKPDRGRGRPPFQVTQRLRRKVEQARAIGMSQDEIAMAVGCSTNTLLKYFMAELQTGHAKRRFEVADMLFREARGGNVSAMRKLFDETLMKEEPPAPESDDDCAADTELPILKPAPKGKKEEATDLAKTAHVGTAWDGILPSLDPSKVPKN